MRNQILASFASSALLASCATASQTSPSGLEELLQQTKFVRTACYTGVDTPEDLRPLTDAVNSAIRDVSNLAKPRDPDRVKKRLQTLIGEVDQFATEDREESYRYAIRIWRASGFKGESGLFSKKDADVLAEMPGC
ncbi:MAG: hypothetical protein ACKOQM_10905 [Novosphingobium sp.]